jgi:butyryl-CoA dehydrogenase
MVTATAAGDMQEVNEIRALAREFAAAELRPHTEAWDAAAAIPDDVRAQLAELGFLGMRVPDAYGGMGFDAAPFVAALEELAWGEPAAALLVAAAAIAAESLSAVGNEEQQARWLPGIADGQQRVAVSLVHTDPLPMRAVRTGEAWRLQGTAPWLVDPAAADLALIRAAAEDAAVTFVIPTAAAGWRLAERPQTHGLRPLVACDAAFDDVTLPAAALLDGGSDGIDRALWIGQLGVAAVAVGIAQAALEHATGYAAEREQFGRAIREFEGIAMKLAEMQVRTDAARALVAAAARLETEPLHAAGAKILAADVAMWVTTQAVQIYGGYGYMRDHPVEKLMRDARAAGVLQGHNDALRGAIARARYGRQ